VSTITQGLDGLSGSQVLVDDENLGIAAGYLSHKRSEFIVRYRDIHEQHLRPELFDLHRQFFGRVGAPTNLRSFVPLNMDIRLSDNIEKSLASKIEIFFGVSIIVSLLH
jgi:hypothetical protein